MESLGRILGEDLAAEGGLDELELVQGQAGEATVIFMFDFALCR